MSLKTGKVLLRVLVYQANITANIAGYKEKVYLDVSKTTFKVPYDNHKKSFTKQRHKNDTQLSKGVLGRSNNRMEYP